MADSNGVKNTLVAIIFSVVLSSLAWGFAIGSSVAVNKAEIQNLKEQYGQINKKLDSIIEYQRDHK